MTMVKVMASPESGPAAYMGPQVWMIRRVGEVMVSKSLQFFIIPGSLGLRSMEHLIVLFPLVNLLTTRILYTHIYSI